MAQYDDDDFINIVSKLKFISKIEQGEKIDTQSLTAFTSSFATRLYRTLFSRGESRDTTFRFINDTVNRAFSLIKQYLLDDSGEKRQKDNINELLNSLDASVIGLKHLSDTYHNDRMYVSLLDTLINSINSKTSMIRKTYEKKVNK